MHIGVCQSASMCALVYLHLLVITLLLCHKIDLIFMYLLHVYICCVHACRHIYNRQDEYRAWVKIVAPMENVMRESQKVMMMMQA